MQHATVARFVEQIRAKPAVAPAAHAIAADRYRDQTRFEREAALISRLPRPVALSSELAVGACLPVAGSILLSRAPDGTARAFANACRHRGTRLVDAPCALKAITCPYHAWTYDLGGALIHVPHLPTFEGLDPASRGLRSLPVHEASGVIWLAGAGEPIGPFLSPVAADLAALELDRHVVYRRAHATRATNWKLVIEAFLDGYHIRVLHRDSIYRFFLDGLVASEPVGPHIRALTARRALAEAPEDLSTTDLRTLGTPSLTIFPATVVIVHPDFVSLITLTPTASNATRWEHAMLVPAERAAETDHWDKSWRLIEEGVFQREDLWVCEQAQRAIDDGATDELLFGGLEASAMWFHATLDAALG